MRRLQGIRRSWDPGKASVSRALALTNNDAAVVDDTNIA